MKKVSVLCIESSKGVLDDVVGLIDSKYQVKRSLNQDLNSVALQASRNDLVLIDLSNSTDSAVTLCQTIRKNRDYQELPIIVVADIYSKTLERRSFEAGCNDFISRPIDVSVLYARLKVHLDLKYYRDLLSQENSALKMALKHQTHAISELQDASLSVMISMAEFRDQDTGHHIKRTQNYIMLLARHATHKLNDVHLSESEILMMGRSAPLHDIGKISIPDPILLKKGKLDQDEMAVMKTHVQSGFDILQSAALSMGEHGQFLQIAQDIAISHHERWDGKGYPYQLKGKQIPLSGRLMAIVDVYDALRSERPYKKPFSHAEALEVMVPLQGSHFDPELFQCFLEIQDDVQACSETLTN